MPTFLEGLAETVNRAFCVKLADLTNQTELWRYILEPAFGLVQNTAGLLYNQNCPLYPPPSAEPSDPGVPGGQCEGVSYRVNYSGERNNGTGTGFTPFSDSTQFRTAKVLGIQAVQSSSPFGAFVQVDFSNGSVQGFGFTGIPPDGNQIRNLTITSIDRQDGLPDNCGTIPPTYPPYTPGGNVYNDNTSYTNNEGDTVTIPVSITLGYATVNIDGTVSIPINAQFSANPEFNANFNFNLNTGTLAPDVSNPSAPTASPCTDPGGYLPDPSIPTPPSSIPDAPPLPSPTEQPTERQRLLKACIVTTSVLDGNETVLFQDDNPDLYIPSLGYVQFLIQVGNSSAWTNDIPVKCLRTFVPCPWDAGAIDVKGTPRYGNEFTVTPVYVTRTFNPTYPPES
jgi:hypothetical protein